MYPNWHSAALVAQCSDGIFGTSPEPDDRFDSAAADHYHHECVSLMIPMLDEKDLVADETLFAAAVILRAFEETNGTCGHQIGSLLLQITG